MKVKPTFFNTRTDRLHWNYTDINNVLLRIILEDGLEFNFIYRFLKKNDFDPLKYFERNNTDVKVLHSEVSLLSKVEYDMLKILGTPNIGACVRKIYRTKL